LVFKSHPSFNNVGFATHGVVVGSTNQRFPTVASFGAQVRRSKAQSSVLRRVQSHGDSVPAILMWDSDDHSTKAGLVVRLPGSAGRIFGARDHYIGSPFFPDVFWVKLSSSLAFTPSFFRGVGQAKNHQPAN
jgi:hypothetical protein